MLPREQIGVCHPNPQESSATLDRQEPRPEEQASRVMSPRHAPKPNVPQVRGLSAVSSQDELH